MKPYSESPFHRDVKNGLKLNFHAEMMEKIKSWDICKICDTGESGEVVRKGRAWILIKLHLTHMIIQTLIG